MKTAMILAAGRGERLRPLTDLTPKAMCAVRNIPLIEYHVRHLAKAGFNRLVINHAWLGGQIRQHLGNGSRFGVEIVYAPEPPGGLETGGGIVNALPLLGNKPFLTVNADILTDFDFSRLNWRMDGATDHNMVNTLAHLVLIHKPAYFPNGDFGLSSAGWIDNEPRLYTFSGIACYSPAFFSNETLGRYSVTPLLRQHARMKRLTGEMYTGKWIDIGSLERLQDVERMADAQ